MKNSKRTFLFYMGHPAHFHLFKEPIRALSKKGVECIILIKSKDVLQDLLDDSEFSYINVYEGERKDGFIPLVSSFLSKLWTLGKYVRQYKPDLLIASAAEFALLGRLFNIPSCILFEDDFEAIPQFAKIVGPFATHLVCPISCSAGKWEYKAIKYKGYHELAYLAPKYFSPDQNQHAELFSDKKNFLMRFSKLKAYHDTGIQGIQDQLALQLVSILSQHGRVFITSERPLPPEIEPLRVSIAPKELHSFMTKVDLLVCDSQTMTAEAAVLGIPSLRFNGFVGRLGYLEELEHTYHLTKGVKIDKPDQLIEETKRMAKDDTLKDSIQEYRQKMLSQSVDVTAFLTELFYNRSDNGSTPKNK